MFLLYMQEGPYRKMTEIDVEQRTVHGDLTRKFLCTPDTGAGGESKIRVRQVRPCRHVDAGRHSYAWLIYAGRHHMPSLLVRMHTC